ncbi:unnamed protein product [Paramecium primaurelia]|uniref:Transmembrane protein n=1 Tax=Paramecium primaurelia TaxID=5886 RepID=A0A8S1QL83_PARPR|nr:unnamed protein product [Paramecium primaurelia]
MDKLLCIRLNNAMMEMKFKMMDVLTVNLNAFLIAFHVQITKFVLCVKTTINQKDNYAYQSVVMALLLVDLKIVMMEMLNLMTDAINANLNVHKVVLIVKMDKFANNVIINTSQIIKRVNVKRSNNQMIRIKIQMKIQMNLRIPLIQYVAKISSQLILNVLINVEMECLILYMNNVMMETQLEGMDVLFFVLKKIILNVKIIKTV